MKLRKLFANLFLGALALFLAACTTASTPPAEEVTLDNTQWNLVSIVEGGQETPVVAGTTANLQFQEGQQAVGTAGCNSFGGTYAVQGNTITFTEVASTLMLCEDEGVMEQEQRFLNGLNTATTFELSGNNLVINFAGGQLNFTRANQ